MAQHVIRHAGLEERLEPGEATCTGHDDVGVKLFGGIDDSAPDGGGGLHQERFCLKAVLAGDLYPFFARLEGFSVCGVAVLGVVGRLVNGASHGGSDATVSLVLQRLPCRQNVRARGAEEAARIFQCPLRFDGAVVGDEHGVFVASIVGVGGVIRRFCVS